MSAEFVDASGVTRLQGSIPGGAGSSLIWQGVYSNIANYVPGDVVIVLNFGTYFLSFCIAPVTGIDPFTDTGGTGKLGPHWYVEF